MTTLSNRRCELLIGRRSLNGERDPFHRQGRQRVLGDHGLSGGPTLERDGAKQQLGRSNLEAVRLWLRHSGQ